MDPTDDNPSSYSMDPLLEALSSAGSPPTATWNDAADEVADLDTSSIAGGLVILQPPLACCNRRSHAVGSYASFFPRARFYEPGWTLHCLAEGTIRSREWHEFMSSLQANLNRLAWRQFTFLFAPVCVMSVLDVFNLMTETYFWILFASIFVVGAPAALYNRYAFHKKMQYLVQEWRFKFLEHGLLLEYRQRPVYQLWCIRGTESHLVFRRQHHSLAAQTPV